MLFNHHKGSQPDNHDRHLESSIIPCLLRSQSAILGRARKEKVIREEVSRQERHPATGEDYFDSTCLGNLYTYIRSYRHPPPLLHRWTVQAEDEACELRAQTSRMDEVMVAGEEEFTMLRSTRLDGTFLRNKSTNPQ